jgi:ketosteroid isomerase-like protein
MTDNQYTSLVEIPRIDSAAPASAVSELPGPVEAVIAWWSAIHARDLTALAELLAEDYIVSGGPAGRTVGRQAVLDQASAFASQATIDDWTIADMELRAGSDHAVCCYGWTEQGTHAGVPFALRGLATDILQVRGATWVHLARHVSMDDTGAGDGGRAGEHQ